MQDVILVSLLFIIFFESCVAYTISSNFPDSIQTGVAAVRDEDEEKKNNDDDEDNYKR